MYLGSLRAFPIKGAARLPAETSFPLDESDYILPGDFEGGSALPQQLSEDQYPGYSDLPIKSDGKHGAGITPGKGGDKARLF